MVFINKLGTSCEKKKADNIEDIRNWNDYIIWLQPIVDIYDVFIRTILSADK